MQKHSTLIEPKLANNMKQFLFTLAVLLCCIANAQRGYKHINLDMGVNLEGQKSYLLSLEFNKGNYSAWDITVQYHPSTFDGGSIMGVEQADIKEELYLLGAHYKPLILKHKNLVFNFSYGLNMGRTKGLLFGAAAGFELTYHLPGTFAIYLKQANNYIINIDNRFRHSVNLGLKIPL